MWDTKQKGTNEQTHRQQNDGYQRGREVGGELSG